MVVCLWKNFRVAHRIFQFLHNVGRSSALMADGGRGCGVGGECGADSGNGGKWGALVEWLSGSVAKSQNKTTAADVTLA